MAREINSSRFNSIFWKILSPQTKRIFSDTVKIPLRKAIVHFAEMYPEPTHDNCTVRNTHILLDIKDEFAKHDNNKTRTPMILAALKILICEYEHDIYYRKRADWFVDQLKASTWSNRSGAPDSDVYAECWVNDTGPKRPSTWLEAVLHRRKNGISISSTER